MSIINTMMEDIACSNLSVVDRLDAKTQVHFLDSRIINMMLVGSHSLPALQELFQFQSTQDLDHLVLWPVQAFSLKTMELLAKKDGNGQPFIDIVLTGPSSQSHDIPDLKNRLLRIDNYANDQIRLLHDIVQKTSLKKRLLYINNLHNKNLTGKGDSKNWTNDLQKLFEEALPTCACNFHKTREMIIQQCNECCQNNNG